ncbi:MAG TPA: sugar kinase [Anaerolineaceae bacterium]
MVNKILSLGELLVEVMRPGIDQPLTDAGQFLGPYPSGAPAIFIDAAARLGCSTGFAGVVGADDFGVCIVNRLQRDRVDTTMVRVMEGLTTGIAFVAYRGDGSRTFVFHLKQSAAADLGVEDLLEEDFRRAAWVHITGSTLSFSDRARQACYRAIDLCKAGGGKVCFDPNLRPELLGIEGLRAVVEPVLRSCDVLFPSGAEAALLTGEENSEKACRALVERGIPIVALKQGEKGSTVYTRGEALHIESLPVKEVDPTGAGDCFDAGFITGLLEGWDLGRVARFANVVGALSVTRQGPMEGAPDRAEVFRWMAG